jgi:hypothetical protein
VGALAPIATSATVTSEALGRQIVHAWEGRIRAYLEAARAVGAALLLQLQPGRACLDEIVEHWRVLLDEPDVGVLVDTSPDVAFAGQVDQLQLLASLVVDQRRGAHPIKASLFVCGETSHTDADITAVTLVDLRVPGALLPHLLLSQENAPDGVVYQ